jgi:hypothetical protein
MPDLNKPSLDSAFHTLTKRMVRLLEHANAVTPIVRQKSDLAPELADALILVVRLEAFFNAVVSLGTRHREQTVRRELVKRGLKHARNCSLPELVKLIRSKISFENNGAKLDELFQLMFGCSVWPSNDVRDVVLDLVLLRNMIVHNSGEDFSQDGVAMASYARQFRRADVLQISDYGGLAVYRVDPYKMLTLMRDAALSIVALATYLEVKLIKDTGWTTRG